MTKDTPSQPIAEGLPPLPELPFSPYLLVDWTDRTKTRTLYTPEQMRAYALAAIAAAPVAPPIAEGFVMVPIVPTEKQLDLAAAFALRVSLGGEYGWTEYMRDLYTIFLKSAPPPGADHIGGVNKMVEAAPQRVPLTEAQAQELIEDFAFEAGRSTVAVIQDLDMTTAEGIDIKQSYNHRFQALLSALTATPEGK